MDQADRAHPLCPLVYPISSLSESATIVLGVLLVVSAVNGMVKLYGHTFRHPEPDLKPKHDGIEERKMNSTLPTQPPTQIQPSTQQAYR